MKNNKAARILNAFFAFSFTVVFLALLFFILTIGYKNNTERNTYNCTLQEYIIIIITGIVLTFIFSALYYLLNKNKTRLIKRKLTDSTHQTRIIILISAAAMLVLQLLAAYFLAAKPTTDLEIINKYALSFAKTGNFDLIQKNASDGFVYMIRYPNNLALMFFLSFLYRIDYLLTGYVSNYIAAILNTFAINASVLMTALLAQKLFGNKKALMTMLLCALFVPYYTFTPYFYTDTLSMPFFVGALYLFFSALRSQTKYKKYVMMAVSGAVTLLGFKMKGSVAILLAVALVYLLLKLGIKKFACFALSLVVGFGSMYAVWTTAYKASNIITEEQSDRYEFPATHWIMMGLKGYGTYTLSDSKYTQRFESKKEKTDATLEIIWGRIEKRNNETDGKRHIDNMFDHLCKKAVWTWEDGTYYISHHIETPLHKTNALHSFVLNKGDNHFIYYAYCCGFQLFLILMMTLSAIRAIIKPEINEKVLLRGVVFTIFVFLLIWETRSRYLYNFTPVFILLAVDGLDVIKDTVCFVKNRIKPKRKKA